MAEDKQTGKKTPKGGRKGGTLFPKVGLKQALDYAKKLVSKTHTGAQPEKTLLPGVFGSSGATGKVRASALKQYGLLEGGADAYKATKLARDIEAAPEEDRPPLLHKAFLNPKLFNQIFETFHGDTVSKAKIEQRAKGLHVHPESAEECAELFVDAALTAGLGTLNGDQIALATAGSISPSPETGIVDDLLDEDGEQGKEDHTTEHKGQKMSAGEQGSEIMQGQSARQSPKPGVALNLNVDSSSDPDKLEKQLKLLRRYGMI